MNLVRGPDIERPGFEVGGGQQSSLPVVFWLMQAMLAVAFFAGLIIGWNEAETMLLLIALSVPVGVAAKLMPTGVDGRWLARLLAWGWMAKVAGSIIRYAVLQLVYRGLGDATGYHGTGMRYAEMFRSFELPPFDTGTRFLDFATGVLYIPYIPTKLGGFLIFATLAFMGQIMFYAAFRRAFPTPRVKWYGLLVFFFPNLLFWPSSIGKDSLMVFFLGMATFGVVGALKDYRLRWVIPAGLGMAGAGVIRSHMALLVGIAAVIAMLVGRRPVEREARMRQLATVGAMALLLVGTVRLAVDDFGIDLSSGISETLLEDELDPIFSSVESNTDQGGSAVEGSAIRGPADVAEAFVRVVFRPLLTDADKPVVLLNSLFEGTPLAILFLWRTPAILRNLRRKWRDPYINFCGAYTAGFVFGHSAVLNLGIMARQRSQLIPLILVLLVELGARPRPPGDERVESDNPEISSTPGSSQLLR